MTKSMVKGFIAALLLIITVPTMLLGFIARIVYESFRLGLLMGRDLVQWLALPNASKHRY